MRHEVTLLDVESQRNTSQIKCEKIQASVLDRPALLKALEHKEAVVHLAAVSRVEWGQLRPFECVNTNVLGTSNVLEAIRASETRPLFILVSSREVYGEPSLLPVSESHPKRPISIYGASKLAAESLTRTYCESFHIPYAILRLSNTYGSARDLPERVIPRFAKAALSGSTLVVNGGKQCLDFTYIKDVTKGIALLVENLLDGKEGLIGQDLHFVTGKGTTVLDLARLIKEIAGSQSEIEVRDSRAFDVQGFVGDPSKTLKLLQFELGVDLSRGLHEYLKELREQD